MTRKSIPAWALLALLSLTAPPLHAQQDQALIDALVRKGILSQKEAEQIQAEVEKEADQTPAPPQNKIKIGDWVDELRLSGEIRLRNQWDDSTPQLPKAPRQTTYTNHSQRDRWRFRLRLNADFKLKGNFFGGVQLSTSQNGATDSSNQTLGQGFDNYSIYITRAFLGWAPADGLTFVGGKQPNPFYTTEMVWDPNVNPQGLVERIDFHKLFNLSFGESSYAKDGKAPAAPPPEKPANALEVSLIAGQFIFFDNNESNLVTSGTGRVNQDAYLFETQLLTRLKLGKALAITVAPALFVTNDSVAGLAGNPPIALQNTQPFQGPTRDQLILLAPGDVSFLIGKIPVKAYWDLAYNFSGDDRWNNEYGPLYSNVTFNRAGTAITGFPAANRIGPSFSDNFAYEVGVKIGENKKQGDFAIFGDWRQVGLTSVDPNLNTPDFALSSLNTQGIRLGLAYNVTDYATFAVTWYHSWALTRNLFGGAATGTIPASTINNSIAPFNHVDVLQVDFLVNF
ncbi:MAG: putative porin [Verrucomicrobia bacterium]|nr:putative porin [Verrucomicrobiota bacterium]